jgi:hypothetical protein
MSDSFFNTITDQLDGNEVPGIDFNPQAQAITWTPKSRRAPTLCGVVGVFTKGDKSGGSVTFLVQMSKKFPPSKAEGVLCLGDVSGHDGNCRGTLQIFDGQGQIINSYCFEPGFRKDDNGSLMGIGEGRFGIDFSNTLLQAVAKTNNPDLLREIDTLISKNHKSYKEAGLASMAPFAQLDFSNRRELLGEIMRNLAFEFAAFVGHLRQTEVLKQLIAGQSRLPIISESPNPSSGGIRGASRKS